MNINLQKPQLIRFTSNKEHEPGKVEYSHKYFLDQEKEALKTYYEDITKFDDDFLHIGRKTTTKPLKIKDILSNLVKKVKK